MITNILPKIRTSIILKISIFSFLLIALSSISSPGQAKAAILQNCTEVGQHFYNPTIIVRVRDHNGNNIRYSSDFSVQVETVINPGLSSISNGKDQKSYAINWPGKINIPNSGTDFIRARESDNSLTACANNGTLVPALKFGAGGADTRPWLDCRYGKYDDGARHGLGFIIRGAAVHDTYGLTGNWIGVATQNNNANTYSGARMENGTPTYYDLAVEDDSGNWSSVNGSEPVIVLDYQTDPPVSTTNITFPPGKTLDCDLGEGWVFSRALNNGSGQVKVSVIIDGGPGEGKPEWNFLTEIERPDVNAVYGITGKHGYSFSPRGSPEGKNVNFNVGHTLNFFAANLPGSPLFQSVWMEACPDPPPSGFTVTPKPREPILNSPEDPKTANFYAWFDLNSSYNVNDVDVVCRYYVQRYPSGKEDELGKVSGKRIITLAGESDKESNVCQKDNLSLPSDLQPGDKVCVSAIANPKEGKVRSNGNIIGRKDSPTDVPPGCTPMENRPYVSFYGNDVKTGGDVSGVAGCESKPGAIRAFTNASNYGASVQFAAFAIVGNSKLPTSGTIQGLTSAALRGGKGYPEPPADLLAEKYGVFNASCSHYYYDDKDSGASRFSGSQAIITSGMNGKYNSPGGIEIKGGSVGKGKAVFIYIDGDVKITDDITLYGGNMKSKNDIPSLYIIAKGSILIDKNVTNLQGVFVAQEATSVINTCTNSGAPYLIGELFNQCGKQLFVDGAFVAKKVIFGRTFGSLRNGASDNAYAPISPKGCSTGSDAQSTNTCAAEVFRYSPAMYLAKAPTQSSTIKKGEKQYEFVSNLPPLL